MAEDRIGVRDFSVKAARNHPDIEKKALQRLDVMQRELTHLQGALARLRAALMNRSLPTSSLSSAVMDSRNWTVSLVMSHAYIQRMIAGDDFVNGPFKDHDQVQKLAAKAAIVGEGDAGKELALMSPKAQAAIKQIEALGGMKPKFP